MAEMLSVSAARASARDQRTQRRMRSADACDRPIMLCTLHVASFSQLTCPVGLLRQTVPEIQDFCTKLTFRLFPSRPPAFYSFPRLFSGGGKSLLLPLPWEAVTHPPPGFLKAPFAPMATFSRLDRGRLGRLRAEKLCNRQVDARKAA